MDRIGKKLEVKCLCSEDCDEMHDPYLEIARENAEAVELRNDLEQITQHND